MARASSTRKAALRPSTFSASATKLLRPLLNGAKREAQIVAAHYVRGKVIRLASDTLMMIVEQKGNDIFRGGSKTIADALERGIARIGVDKILLQRAQALGITVVGVFYEDLSRLAVARVSDFFDNPDVYSRANWRGRSTQYLRYERLHHRFLAPPLQKRKPRAIA